MCNSGNSLLEEWEEGAGQTKGGVQHLTKEIVSGNDKIKKKKVLKSRKTM